MSDIRTEEFATPTPIVIEVEQPAGTLDVRTGPTETTTVTVRGENSGGAAMLDKIDISYQDGTLVIDVPRRLGSLFRYPKLSVTVIAPEQSSLRAELAAADLTCSGPLGQLHARTASGDVQTGDITGDVTAHSASGDLSIGRVGGAVSVRSMSGDVMVAAAGGDAEAHTASGDIAIRTAAASVRARSASGDVAVGVTRQGTVEVNTASGDVTIGVAPGIGVWLDVSTASGSTNTDLAVGDHQPASGCDLRITARTMSGDVRVHRAATQPVSST